MKRKEEKMPWQAKKDFRYEAIKFAQLMDVVFVIKHSIFKLEFYVTCDQVAKNIKSTKAH